MAGVSTKEIKTRIRSMESTKQITKAMEMVAASKLRKHQSRVQASRPYFEILSDTIDAIIDANAEFSSPYLIRRTGDRTCYVVIAGDRGLAGGYNSNVFRQVTEAMGEHDGVILPVGRKTVDHFTSVKKPMLTANYAVAEAVSMGDCFSIAKDLCKRYLSGEFDRICVCYTNFVSVLSQVPQIRELLPLAPQTGDQRPKGTEILYEPDSESVFAAIVPEYLGGILYGALCESRASEQAARRSAMDSATQNAEEMIGQLSLQFNRARQAAITQEITEIVAGSNA